MSRNLLSSPPAQCYNSLQRVDFGIGENPLQRQKPFVRKRSSSKIAPTAQPPGIPPPHSERTDLPRILGGQQHEWSVTLLLQTPSRSAETRCFPGSGWALSLWRFSKQFLTDIHRNRLALLFQADVSAPTPLIC